MSIMMANAFHVTEAIIQLCDDVPDWKQLPVLQKLRHFVSVDSERNPWTCQDRQSILDLLAQCISHHQLTEIAATYFSPILLELLMRMAKKNDSLSHRFALFNALSRLIGRYASATNFAYDKFTTQFFGIDEIVMGIENDHHRQRQFLESCLVFLNFDCDSFHRLIDWTFLTTFVERPHPDRYCRWLSLKLYASLLRLDRDEMIENGTFVRFTDEECAQFGLKCYELRKCRSAKYCDRSIRYGPITDMQGNKLSSNVIYESDFSSDIVCVAGILLEHYSRSRVIESKSFDLDNECSFIVLPSTEVYLQAIALGVSHAKPTLIEGPMGCGKTSLIRYLARLTGRHRPPDILTIQISDQVDSKYLLGSYICSDVPGEFVFNLGPLLRAVQHGSWIILEDIDAASSDVISLITSIVESKGVSTIAGCENKIDKYDRNFRIFFTRRTSESGHNSDMVLASSSSSMLINLLRNACTTITICNLDLAQTKRLIVTKWPNLSPISDKIVEIYQSLIACDDSSNAKRFITLRDLLKWCERLHKYFDANSTAEVSTLAFLDAYDCFVAFASSPELCRSKAIALSSHLNITKQECEQLLDEREPKLVTTERAGFSIGRQTFMACSSSDLSAHNFAFTTQSLQLLEKLSVCVSNGEAVLLCGETGVGKTSCIQYLASLYGKRLTVINMNQQSDSVELFGGYKPIDIKYLINAARDTYQSLFAVTFDSEKNASFMTKFAHIYNKRDWRTLLQIMSHVCTKALDSKCSPNGGQDDLRLQWIELRQKLQQIADHMASKSELTFAFMEGALTQAVKSGDWVLLDEINLAEYETLQSLLTLLENDTNFMLFDKASDQSVPVHADFRLFACMNPATDVGKRQLPIGIQNRFTEFYIHQIATKSQLRILVQTYVKALIGAATVESIVNFYVQVKQDAADVLKDINGYRPIYSLRNLCRALRICRKNPFGLIQRSIYEAFCLSFLSNLQPDSCRHVQNLIEKTIFAKDNIRNLLKSKITIHDQAASVTIDGCPFPIHRGTADPDVDESYILTETVRKNLVDVCRIVCAGKTLPILLQGETSVGKTSLISWLAKATGNVCIRVNNHEHTDLQEYVGSYCSDETGRIVFKEGILVEAMRKGHWLILDELNLAPTEVLEALNRVLDDNRELFIPETQEVIKAHPHFLLFATQNPPGRYGGRKVLSRAFRNRFIELHFSEIPPDELETILHRKCRLPKSYAKRMVSVLVELQRCRSKSDIFAGKHGLITLRDLFRWGNRYMRYSQAQDNSIVFFDWDKFLASQGYMLLAGRVRKPEEVQLIQTILENKFRCKLDMDELFYGDCELYHSPLPAFSNVVWTKAFKRLATLIQQAIKYEEPVLLVGETGCGKTTICQYFAARMSTNLRIVNCHMNTESADFLGSLRPNRNLATGAEGEKTSSEALFEWIDGPLIRAMKEGEFLLVDEISLADDSVLERLNSVLEFERSIFLAECSDAQSIRAHANFRYFATMNPGGDFGKKELSPALRDRFTEIWCPAYEDENDIRLIIEHNLTQFDHSPTRRMLKPLISAAICHFITWFQSEILNLKQSSYSIRDIITWVDFINQTSNADNNQMGKYLQLPEAFINGAFLVCVDSLGTCNSLTRNFHADLQETRNVCEHNLRQLSQRFAQHEMDGVSDSQPQLPNEMEHYFTVPPFSVRKGEYEYENDATEQASDSKVAYIWKSSGVQRNLFRIMRSMQLDKPILLEGSPGVGKTSLVEALAAVTGHRLIRINLSEQTDISDLFGSDLPMEGENCAGKFAFRDGPLLAALKSRSTWILLDELNLASQSVLEGLNACLDHRGEIYIPELNRTFRIDKGQNRIFASQNPFSMDGSRKGLPKSFLNRFTIVYVDHLGDEDFAFILRYLFPALNGQKIDSMIRVNRAICDETVADSTFARTGGPFEFNLRDLIRWARVTVESAHLLGDMIPEHFFDLIYTNKMRSKRDREKIRAILKRHTSQFSSLSHFALTQNFHLFGRTIQFGYSLIEGHLLRRSAQPLSFILERHRAVIESILKCIEMRWMTILIGRSGAGKTFLVKMLANICGQPLRVFSVNSEMDTTDLLGAFEQQDIASEVKHLECDLLDACDRLFLPKLCAHSQLMAQFLHLRAQFERSPSTTIANQFDHNLCSLTRRLDAMHQILSLFDLCPLESDEHDRRRLLERVNYCTKIAQNRHLLNGSFVWKDSLLVKCVERGEWLLIDNANQLNASVLDRLNGLLERDQGTLVINEKGGDVAAIKAHHNFRLFLTINPLHGELSRAMRNRGIEIVLPDHEQDNDEHANGANHISDSNAQQMKSIFSSMLSDATLDRAQTFTDYGTLFRAIDQIAVQSQNGFHSSQAICGEPDHSSPPPLCVNNLLVDPSTFYVLQDFDSLRLSVPNCDQPTKLRLFLENCSTSDLALRREMLKPISLDSDIQVVRQIERMEHQVVPHQKDLFDQSKNNILAQHIARLPVDIRENWVLRNYLCHHMSPQVSENWNLHLNHYHLSLWWDELCSRSLRLPPDHNSLSSLATMISSQGDMAGKKYPAFLTLINRAIQIIGEEVAHRCLLSPNRSIFDNDISELRNDLLWCHQLVQCARHGTSDHQIPLDWNLFLSEQFFPLWFMFNERILPRIELCASSSHTLTQVNTLLNLNDDNHAFDCLKYQRIRQLANNYFHFRTEQDIQLFERINELCQLLSRNISTIKNNVEEEEDDNNDLKRAKCQLSMVAKRNAISFEMVDMIEQYYAHDKDTNLFNHISSRIGQFCDSIASKITVQASAHDQSGQQNAKTCIANDGNESPLLVQSDALLTSILYLRCLDTSSSSSSSSSSSLSSSSSCLSNQDDIISMARANNFTVHIPLCLLFARLPNAPKRDHRFIDAFIHICTSMNVDFNLNWIIQYFTTIGDANQQDSDYEHHHHHSRSNPFISRYADSKTANLTIELLPLLSLTCFNIYQTEKISIEQFFSKNFTLNFYSNFLCQNYVTLKSRNIGTLFLDRLLRFALSIHRELTALLPDKFAQQIGIENATILAQKDGEQAEDGETEKYLQLVWIGYQTATTTVTDFPIDPIIRQQAILRNCQLETDLLRVELSLRDEMRRRRLGLPSCLHSTPHSIHHSPPLLSLDTSLRQNEKTLANLCATGIPTRLDPCKYSQLRSDIEQFVSTVFNWSHLGQICAHLRASLALTSKKTNQMDESSIAQAISSAINCQHSLREFVHYIERSYLNYHDLITPFIAGVCLALKGLQLATFRLESARNARSCLASADRMSIITHNLFRFVNTQCPHEIAEYLHHNDCISTFVDIAAKLGIEEKPLLVALLRSAFLEIENSILLGHDKSYLLSLYLKLVDLFVRWWKCEKQQEEMEKIKNEAIFHMKLEDEADDAKLRTIFPSFESKFQDLLDDYRDASDFGDNLRSEQAGTSGTFEQLKLSRETLLFIVRSHIKLITLNEDHFISSASDNNGDFPSAYLIRYRVLSDIFKRTLGLLNIDERALIDGHLLVNRHLISIKRNANNDPEQVERESLAPLNVYRESSIEQTRQCFAVLERMKVKIVDNLLPQFERHPTLLKLLKVIDRIEAIEIDSSLLSFATGLELILRAAEDWQLIAHRGISLIEHLNEITQLLVQWRKLEIANWSHCLRDIERRVEENELINWWFQFYTTLDEITQIDESDADEDNNERIHQRIRQFIGSVAKFIENSNLGQFAARMKILNCFVHHLRHRPNQSKTGTLQIALENLYNFYSHFATQVQAAIEAERAPIEKEVRDFVTISKWNANNFWSLKASLDKSHRQLYGYMKKFELALCKAANLTFAFDKQLKPNEDTGPNGVKLAFASVFAQHDSNNHSQLVDHHLFGLIEARKYPLLVDRQKYARKSYKLCRKICKRCGDAAKSPILHRIVQLERRNNLLICGINEYSALRVPTLAMSGKDTNEDERRTKWRKAVAHIQSQKRRALIDLFKRFTAMGLSFRKGLVHLERESANESIIVDRMISSIAPLTTAIGDEDRDIFHERTSIDITACETYFYKCISGLMKFGKAIENPHQQLTRDVVERIKGFTAQLTQIMCQRRSEISDTLTTFTRLHSLLRSLNHKCDDERSSPHSIQLDCLQMCNHFSAAQTLLTKMCSFVIRLKTIVECLRDNSDDCLRRQSQLATLRILPQSTHDEAMTQLDTEILQNIIIDLRSNYSIFRHFQSIFCTTADLGNLRNICQQLTEALDRIKSFFANGSNDFAALYRQDLRYFQVEIDCIAEYVSKNENLAANCAQLEDCSMQIESQQNDALRLCHLTIKNILLSIEAVYKHVEGQAEVIEDKQDDDEDQHEMHIVRQNELAQMLSHFNAQPILGLVEKFFASLNRTGATSSPQLALLNYRLICALHPFMRQYVHLLRCTLAASFGSLRSVSKLLHVTLSLFNQLVVEGFCLPPEPNDSAEQDRTELKDIQNSGFGEGDTSGAKDVSDRLDCQDQLDELMKNDDDEHEQQQDESSQTDDKNDKGIEMDEDFDANEFGDEKQTMDEEDENGKEDDEEENDQLDDKMGDVDNEENVLDEQLWGDDDADEADEDEKDIDDLNETEQSGGKDNIESRMVANESNQDLKKNEDENANNQEDENEADERQFDEINQNEMDDEYRDEVPDKYKNEEEPSRSDAQKDTKMDLPDDMQLDDDEENEEEEKEVQNEENGDETGENDGEESMEIESNNELEGDEEEDNDNEKCSDMQMLQQSDEQQEAEEEEEKTAFDIDTHDQASEAQLCEPSQPNITQNDQNVAANPDQQQQLASAQSSAQNLDQDKNDEANEEASGTASVIEDKAKSGQNYDKDRRTDLDDNHSSHKREDEEQSISKNNKNSRSIAEDVASTKKRRKIMQNCDASSKGDAKNEEECSERQSTSDAYRHVDDASRATDLAYDIAPPDQHELQQDAKQAEKTQRGLQFDDDDQQQQQDVWDDRSVDRKQQSNGDEAQSKTTGIEADKESQAQDEGMKMEGEFIPTIGVAQSSNQSSFHQSNMIVSSEHSQSITLHDEQHLCNQFDEDHQPAMDSAEMATLMPLWRECERKIEPLVYELCNQLQLVLEPTKCAKFRGDYKCGKRLNMRKVIAYVASDFRKDKIWLRRSKPSKRQYEILIAVDDSLSMSDNRSKQMAFESLILLGKSLSIIESGALSVVSFGEAVRVLHHFHQPFTDQAAFRMFAKFGFDQQQTRITEMLQCAISLFANRKHSNASSSARGANQVYQLLLIVSDGRGMNSAENEHLHRAILSLKERNIFSVFIIIDNPEQTNSIVEIRMPIFNRTTAKLDRFEYYIERFPFPYYVILKDINTLPGILGEALRQWFEMISHESQ